MRYAQDRYMPDGKWVQTTLAESVVGVHHRKADRIHIDIFFQVLRQSKCARSLADVSVFPLAVGSPCRHAGSTCYPQVVFQEITRHPCRVQLLLVVLVLSELRLPLPSLRTLHLSNLLLSRSCQLSLVANNGQRSLFLCCPR